MLLGAVELVVVVGIDRLPCPMSPPPTLEPLEFPALELPLLEPGCMDGKLREPETLSMLEALALDGEDELELVEPLVLLVLLELLWLLIEGVELKPGRPLVALNGLVKPRIVCVD
jgi:hypothetical protein